MNDEMRHPSTQSLEALVEGQLEAADRAVIESHLIGCPRCENRVEEFRSLFHALTSLARFAPVPGFVDRVMARVRVAQPWHVRASAVLARFLPKTTRGWALAAAFLALPFVAGGTLVTWLLSKSYVTTHGLWVFTTDAIASATQSLVTGAVAFLLDTDVVAWLTRSAGTLVDAGGPGGVGAIAAIASALTLTSVWILYTNLFRPADREPNHVTLSI